MTGTPTRVSIVLTHPVQYFAPWFRYLAAERKELALTVFYAAQPTPEAQGTGFGRPFTWDGSLMDGYDARVLGGTASGQRFAAEHSSSIDVPALEAALLESRPDAIVIPGWHARVYLRALDICRRHGIPAIYRGDTHLLTAPSGLLHPLWRARTRSRLRRFDAWLSVGTRTRAYLESFRLPEPLIFPSPHAVDNAWFAQQTDPYRGAAAKKRLRESLGLDPDAFIVLFAGKLIPVKRPIDAILAAGRAGSGVQLLMTGDGELRRPCEDAARRASVAAVFSGFLNQSQMPMAYAAADCLVLPSERETWGLVVNEALASGLPCVVTDRVGCAPDLVDGETGAVVPAGDVDALADAIRRLRARRAAGHDDRPACQRKAATFSFARATDGLVGACSRLHRRRELSAANAVGQPRVIACCGNMVIAGGLERMTFEVLRAVREGGAAAHAIVNTWESGAIVQLAEQSGASWSTGYYWQLLARTWRPMSVLRMVWEAVRTSAGLLRDARAFRATDVLVPEINAALRNWPGLLLLKMRGVRVVMRLGNAPVPGRFHRRLWRVLMAPVIDRFVANAHFIARELAAHGIDPARIEVVHNTAAQRPMLAPVVPRDPSRIIFVGQIIPPKGADLLLEALALLVARGIDASLEIVGTIDGWESPAYAGHRDAVRHRAGQPDLAGRVTFSGYREDVPARLARAAVHCCPSRPEQREGFAGVVLEAKQAGLPSVVTPSGALPELVRHRIDGWIVEEASASALAAGLEHFLVDHAARAEAGREAAKSLERFSRERFTSSWQRVFDVDPSRAGAPPGDASRRVS